MADEIVILYTALTATLTLASLLFQLYGTIATEMAANTRKLAEHHRDALFDVDMARKKITRIKRR